MQMKGLEMNDECSTMASCCTSHCIKGGELNGAGCSEEDAGAENLITDEAGLGS
jgi:hypothetical protein